MVWDSQEQVNGGSSQPAEEAAKGKYIYVSFIRFIYSIEMHRGIAFMFNNQGLKIKDLKSNIY